MVCTVFSPKNIKDYTQKENYLSKDIRIYRINKKIKKKKREWRSGGERCGVATIYEFGVDHCICLEGAVGRYDICNGDL